MEGLIDRALSVLFKVADYVTSRISLSSSEPADGSKPKVIRFSPKDVEKVS